MVKALAVLLLALPTLALADKDFVTPDDGAAWDCATDEVVNINYGKGTFAITGACKEVNVNGTSVKVTADDITTLNINGAKNVITVTALGAVNINGASNKVTWKKAKSGKKPTAAVVGKGNGVVKGK